MKKIIIYTTSWCHWCQKTKKFLENFGYSYEERNVELNQEWEKELIQKLGQNSIPVTLVIDEKRKERLIIGYDPLSLKEALEEN